ncbi:hypothetical protein JHK85_017426 [Glycine max]|nr:hypothetical protein JHK85_017426 [Glycine max]KAG5047647.1 hypothetical protein JHK86_017053 [Glycine max]
MGARIIKPPRALKPGFIFETAAENYLLFLCRYGYSQENIRLMSKTNFSCERNTTEDPISYINYPSISIKNIKQGAKSNQKNSYQHEISQCHVYCNGAQCTHLGDQMSRPSPVNQLLL